MYLIYFLFSPPFWFYEANQKSNLNRNVDNEDWDYTEKCLVSYWVMILKLES